jgi:hypothetical protein
LAIIVKTMIGRNDIYICSTYDRGSTTKTWEKFNFTQQEKMVNAWTNASQKPSGEQIQSEQHALANEDSSASAWSTISPAWALE